MPALISPVNPMTYTAVINSSILLLAKWRGGGGNQGGIFVGQKNKETMKMGPSSRKF